MVTGSSGQGGGQGVSRWRCMVDGCRIARIWNLTSGDPETEADAHYRGAHVAPDGSLVASARDAQTTSGQAAGGATPQPNGTEGA